MLKWLVVRWLLLAVALAVAAWAVPSVDIDGGVPGVLWVSALLGLVNVFVGPLLRLLALPLTILTFGLFAIVVNAAILGIVAGVSDHLDIGGFWATCLAAIIISVVSMVLGFFVGSKRGSYA